MNDDYILKSTTVMHLAASVITKSLSSEKETSSAVFYFYILANVIYGCPLSVLSHEIEN